MIKGIIKYMYVFNKIVYFFLLWNNVKLILYNVNILVLVLYLVFWDFIIGESWRIIELSWKYFVEENSKL